MTNQKDHEPEDKSLLSMHDLYMLLKRSKWKIIFSFVAMGLFGAFYALLKPIQYNAEATFRERGGNGAGFARGGLSELFMFGGNSADFEIFSYIKSQNLMNDVIDQLNLQGVLVRECDYESYPATFYRNLLIEWNYFTESFFPVLEERICPLKITQLSYDGETPAALYLKFDGDHTFTAFEGPNEVGSFEMGQPFAHRNYSFTLASNIEGAIAPEDYSLVFKPKNVVSKDLIGRLKCETLKDDKKVLKLSFYDRNRQFASQFLNTLMDSYQALLKKNHDKVAAIQLDYLQKKEEFSANKLKVILNDHADNIASDLYLSGFADSETEMNFLSRRQNDYKEKLLANELELRRLKIVDSNAGVYSQYSSSGDAGVINRILTEIRDLKQQRDDLELGLRKQDGLEEANLQLAFDQRMNELLQVQEYNIELDEILAQFAKGEKPRSDLRLTGDSHYLIREWQNKLDETSYGSPLMYEKTREHFKHYLDNLHRLFGVHEKILMERLTHQQNSYAEFEGINLAATNDLYVQYCKQLMQEESIYRQNQFIISQIEKDDFEITSLSSVLKDPVSLTIINEASQIVLALKDQNNQSQKELERLQQELDLQRLFLNLHLKQMNQIVQVNQKLINEKIKSLQNINIELINQRVSLLEENLSDYVKSRMENLDQENDVFNQHLEEINEQMAFLPKRRVQEQLLEQQLALNVLMVEEIAKMVESKNISHNLDIIQSAPIDLATPPLHPKKPGLFLYTVLGSIFGGLMGSIFIVGRAISKGLPASMTMLRTNGQNVAGALSQDYDPHSTVPIKDVDLQTLRRLYAFFANWAEDHRSTTSRGDSLGKLLLLVQGHGPDYAYDLAELISFKNKKVVVLELSFDHMPAADTQPGLLSYLEGKTDEPKIVKSSKGDKIYSGGISRFATELLRSKRFKELLTTLQSKYDWVIAATNALPHNAAAESLAQGFPFVAVTVHQENMSDLKVYLDREQDADKETAYIFAPTE